MIPLLLHSKVLYQLTLAREQEQYHLYLKYHHSLMAQPLDCSETLIGTKQMTLYIGMVPLPKMLFQTEKSTQ